MKKLTIGTIGENELLELAETIKLKSKLIAERQTIASNIKEKGRASCFISFFAHGFSRDLCEEQGDDTIGQLLQAASNKESDFILDKIYDSAISDLEIAISAYRDAEPEPKLRQLDQSVFDGADPKYITAATNEDGRTFLFPVPKSELEHALGCWVSNYRGDSPRVDGLFDASNWQNSLIERKELTGSDLCRAMLKRGDNYIMCRVGLIKEVVIINKFEDGWFYSQGIRRAEPTPINNQGEPLTAADVGL